MKKLLFSCQLLTLSLLFSNSVFAQDANAVCGTDKVHNKLFTENPQLKEQYEAKLTEFRALKKQGKLQAKTNEVFEIPVVVHVLDDGTGKYKLTEKQINDWIARANSVFDGTASDVKSTDQGGTTLPIKLVLAKRTPDNKKSNGIVVHDLSTNPTYVNYGVDGDGLSNDYLKENFSWDSKSYYNIFVTNKIEGVNPENTTSSYTAGYAYYPGGSMDLSVMLYHVAISARDTTFAHEMMHALGVAHPFDGGDGNGSTCGTTENDGIADTQNIRSGLWFGSSKNTYNQYTTYPTVGVTINDCTNTPFDTTLFNIMNYGANRDRFTVGQGEMALAAIQYYRGAFKTSKALLEPSKTTIVTPKDACVPITITGVSTLAPNRGYGIGMRVVKLGDINNVTSTHYGPTPQFYNNYSYLGNANSIYLATLDVNKEHSFTAGTSSTNANKYVVYIDLNNDGILSSNEMVVDNLILNPGSFDAVSTATAKFNIPAGSTLNTPLRMRVIGDFAGVTDFTSCGDRTYGEVEDYVVILTDGTLSTSNLNDKSELDVLTSGNEIIVRSKELIDSIEVYDMNGRLINKSSNINQINFNVRVNSNSGVLVVNTKLKSGKTISKKVIVK